MKLFFSIFVIAIFYPLIFDFIRVDNLKKTLSELFGYGRFVRLYEENGYIYRQTIVNENIGLFHQKRTVITERIGENYETTQSHQET